MEQTVNLQSTLGEMPRQAFLVPRSNFKLPPMAIDGIITIGRNVDNDLCLVDQHVSNYHCQIEHRPQGFFIRDLKSRNGVYVNGVRVTEAMLSDGAHIQVGPQDFIFQCRKPELVSPNLPITSRNKIWLHQLRGLKGVSATELPVFLQGESGAGKEVIAGIIHKLSTRSKGPFITVNCSAFTDSLFESELFGHLRGSFTGASSDRKGALEAARGGTIFLDEIGDLALNLQPKLLRAIENQEIRPLGSDKTISTDVRIISATHKSLDRLVQEGKFRADLFFRIQVVKVNIPPLRERMEDFEDLLYTLCKDWGVRFSLASIELLKKHSWPGNIRELKNTIARAHAIYPNVTVQPDQIATLIDAGPGRSYLKTSTPQQPKPRPRVPTDTTQPPSLMMREIERELIISRLIANNGNQRRTALELGIAKSTLHDRIKSFGINLKSLFKSDVLEEDPLCATSVEDLVEVGSD